jgi:transposase
MTENILNKWIMYHELHHLERLGFSRAKVAHYLGIDTRTAKRYLDMSEAEYEHSLHKASKRTRLLSPYEDFVKGRLTEYPETSTAQIHDWLKEYHQDFPIVCQRTVYNFVMFVRHTHNIPYIHINRDFFPIEELPFGKQAQVDFGVYNMQLSDGKRKKVYFFAMVLSRSRMKYVLFSDKSFTAETVSLAHENAFKFFGGIPQTIVYDQDRTMIVDENLGDIILTTAFKQYTKTRNFELHFCRKADPQSKGKVENVIQYVKKNFLLNRVYHNIDMLNTETMAWLSRTANYLPHNYTKKSPESEFLTEQLCLNPFTPLIKEFKQMNIYNVRKTNTIAYKSNFYTLPMGTYQQVGTQVLVKENQGHIEIYNMQEEPICTHAISNDKGKTISNSNHKRDNSKTLEEMLNQAICCFTDQEGASSYLQQIREKWSRYTRDHFQVILKALSEKDRIIADKTLEFCIKNNILHGYDFEKVLYVLIDDAPKPRKIKEDIKLLNKSSLKKAEQTPSTSNIDDYERIMNK